MSRTNIFARVRSEGRSTDVEIGGRARNNWLNAWINTDSSDGTTDLYVKAEVVGESKRMGAALRRTCRNCGHNYGDDYGKIKECPECQTFRQGVDTRHVHFTIEMPEAEHQSHTVHIRRHNAGLGDLAKFGAMLVAMKGMILESSPDPQEIDNGRYLLEQAGDIIQELETKITDYGKVEVDTPMGKLNLKYLIACAQYVEMLQSEDNQNSYYGEN